MSTTSRYYPNLYKDSVSLMTVSAEIMSVLGPAATMRPSGSSMGCTVLSVPFLMGCIHVLP